MSFPKRRETLAKQLLPDSMVILCGNTEQTRNGDVAYPFRQDSDLLALTGIDSPDIILVGMKDKRKTRWMIFSDPKSEREMIWGTNRATPAEISNVSGISEVHPHQELFERAGLLAQKSKRLYTRLANGRQSLAEGVFLDRLNRMATVNLENLPLEPFLDEIRMYKSSEDIAKMGEAIAVTRDAQKYLRSRIRTGMYEYEIEALVAGFFRSRHVTEAYPTIVASGPNACVLHYTKHTRQIREGEFVLVDFGAEFQGYAADITRVFPVGRVSIRHQAVFRSVWEVQLYAKSLVRPGIRKPEYEKLVRCRMDEELERLGLIPKNSTYEERGYFSKKYYPHSCSHFIGLDVHDVGSRETEFSAGMTVTCEPGIYIPEEGIGIRLEDDLLITLEGSENLSSEIPIEWDSVGLAL